MYCFYCVCVKLLVLLRTSLAAMCCNIMHPARSATACSNSCVLSSESAAAVAYRDLRNVFYLRTVVFQNLLDELFSLSGTFVAFVRQSRPVFPLQARASVLQRTIPVCGRCRKAAFRHNLSLSTALHKTVHTPSVN
jgi:hypothetical protein